MSDLILPTTYTSPLEIPGPDFDFKSEVTTARKREILAQLKTVREEALKLYEPLPYQDAFHRCTAKEAMIQKGNQTGGTVCACVEIARAVTGQDPYGKYPPKNGIAVCVGYGEKHIGTTFWRKLFRPGAFRIIRDLETGTWRTFRPWRESREVDGKPGEALREKESIPAPPLIPKRFIEGKPAWVKRSSDIFDRVKFTTGWELYAANSAGDPEHLQGLSGVWLYLFDEDVAQGGWYAEAVQRTASVNGLLRWDAMPHAKTNDISSFIERADEESLKPVPRTIVIRVEQAENPYLSDAFKEESVRIALSLGEDVYRKRILGQMTNSEVLMYWSFRRNIHGARTEFKPEDEQLEESGRVLRSPLQKEFAKNKFVVPHEWTRRTVTDPGSSVCATLFAATPPPSVGHYVLIYDELYITKNIAPLFAREFKKKIGEQVIEEMLFDMHGGHLRGASSDRMWVHEYQDAIEEIGVRCEATGARFRAACDKIKFREEQLRVWLEMRVKGKDAGFPIVYIDLERCPNLVRQLNHFKKKVIKVNGVDTTLDEAYQRGSYHAAECLEYLAAHGCHYVKPRKKHKALDPIGVLLAEKKKLCNRIRRMRQGYIGEQSTVTLGPQGATK